jgi:hypothetical protein
VARQVDKYTAAIRKLPENVRTNTGFVVLGIATRLGCLRIFKFGLLTRGLLTQNWKPVNNPTPKGCLIKATGCLTKFFLKAPNLKRIECNRFKHLIYRLNSNFSLNCEPYRVNTFTVSVYLTLYGVY